MIIEIRKNSETCEMVKRISPIVKKTSLFFHIEEDKKILDDTLRTFHLKDDVTYTLTNFDNVLVTEPEIHFYSDSLSEDDDIYIPVRNIAYLN